MNSQVPNTKSLSSTRPVKEFLEATRIKASVYIRNLAKENVGCESAQGIVRIFETKIVRSKDFLDCLLAWMWLFMLLFSSANTIDLFELSRLYDYERST
jgi:hypothetical protein